MSETGLLIAQAAFVVLLYGFIWLVVRSSSKQVGVSMPPPPAPVIEPQRKSSPPPMDLDIDMLDAEPDLLEASSAPPIEEPVAAAPPVDQHAHDLVTVEPPPRENDDLEGPAGAFDLTDASRPRLVVESSPVLSAGTEFVLEGGMTIGRSPSSGVLIDDDFVSHMHARVMRRGEFYFISDLGSTNGTTINGRPVDEDRQLRVRDEIRLGETVLRYEE